MAGGCGLAMSADITIASENARFGLTEIKVGLWSMMVSTILRRRVGRNKAIELLLTGDIITAHTAEKIGLINQVVQHDKLEETVMSLANEIANKSPIAVKFGRDAFYATEDMEFVKSLDYLCDRAALLSSTKDAQEGVSAFLEKRRPSWKGI